jgi:hypothetical protein
MKTKHEINTYWNKKAEELLLNRKIVAVRYMDDQEQEALGWYCKCVVMQLDDGTLIYPSRDDEGNDAGALFFQKKKESGELPVIQ